MTQAERTAQHTPGEWTPVDIAIEADDPNRPGFGVVVAWVNRDDTEVDDSTARANARLIAAAPELLACLRGVLQNAGSYIDTEWLERASLAIAKAEGREP